MPNRLMNETSPYLLQHAENPVDWYPWSEAALEKARSEDKPIFLSIGYSACHWCHVMAHESFEDEQVAAILNEHFVSIKVDREERPDLDQIYMTAVQAMTGSGGWRDRRAELVASGHQLVAAIQRQGQADAAEPYRFELEDVVARSLRLDVVDSSGRNTGLVEFAVYGTPIEH